MSDDKKNAGKLASMKERPENNTTAQCPLPAAADLSGVTVVELKPEARLRDYHEAMALAQEEVAKRLGESMLLSWYDRDRNFEAPQHVSECHQDSAVPGSFQNN